MTPTTQLNMPVLSDVEDLDEDGPKFRQKISELEKKTSILKQNVKKILKQGHVLFESVRKSMVAASDFKDCVKELADQTLTLQQGCALIDSMEGVISSKVEDLLRDIEYTVLHPLQSVYDNIKKAEPLKKEFDHQSSVMSVFREN